MRPEKRKWALASQGEKTKFRKKIQTILGENLRRSRDLRNEGSHEETLFCYALYLQSESWDHIYLVEVSYYARNMERINWVAKFRFLPSLNEIDDFINKAEWLCDGRNCKQLEINTGRRSEFAHLKLIAVPPAEAEQWKRRLRPWRRSWEFDL